MNGVVFLFIGLAVLIFGSAIGSILYHLVDWEGIKKDKKREARLSRATTQNKLAEEWIRIQKKQNRC